MAEEKQVNVEEISVNNVGKLEEKLKEAIEKNPDNKPTEEEIKQAEEEFNLASNTFNTKKWNIGETKDSKELYEYTMHYLMDRALWTKNAWMGMIKFKEELEEAIEFIKSKKGKAHLKLGYQALEFLYFILQSPGGIGYQAAKDFEDENEKYVKLFDAVADVLKGARDEVKEIQFLQDKYTAMQQGFYLEIDEPVDENNIPEVVGDNEGNGRQEPEENETNEPKVVIGKVKK